MESGVHCDLISYFQLDIRGLCSYFHQHLVMLPHHYLPEHSQLITLCFFSISALKLLNFQSHCTPQQITSIQSTFSKIRSHILSSLQDQTSGAFRGNSHFILPLPNSPSTFSSLSILALLSNSLSSNNIPHHSKLIHFLLSQLTLPSLSPTHDARHFYSTLASLYILQTSIPSHIQTNLIHILSSFRAHDGGYGLFNHNESHSGATFCVLSSFIILNHKLTCSQYNQTLRWLLLRASNNGINGRTHKPPDSCYCYWVNASLILLPSLSASSSSQQQQLQLEQCHEIFAHSLNFLKLCQSPNRSPFFGAFKKSPSTSSPDLYHAYFALASAFLCLNQLHQSSQNTCINPLLISPLFIPQ